MSSIGKIPKYVIVMNDNCVDNGTFRYPSFSYAEAKAGGDDWKSLNKIYGEDTTLISMKSGVNPSEKNLKKLKKHEENIENKEFTCMLAGGFDQYSNGVTKETTWLYCKELNKCIAIHPSRLTEALVSSGLEDDKRTLKCKFTFAFISSRVTLVRVGSSEHTTCVKISSLQKKKAQNAFVIDIGDVMVDKDGCYGILLSNVSTVFLKPSKVEKHGEKFVKSALISTARQTYGSLWMKFDRWESKQIKQNNNPKKQLFLDKLNGAIKQERDFYLDSLFSIETKSSHGFVEKTGIRLDVPNNIVQIAIHKHVKRFNEDLSKVKISNLEEILRKGKEHKLANKNMHPPVTFSKQGFNQDHYYSWNRRGYSSQTWQKMIEWSEITKLLRYSKCANMTIFGMEPIFVEEEKLREILDLYFEFHKEEISPHFSVSFVK